MNVLAGHSNLFHRRPGPQRLISKEGGAKPLVRREEKKEYSETEIAEGSESYLISQDWAIVLEKKSKFYKSKESKRLGGHGRGRPKD